jgi:hypothetical protein
MNRDRLTTALILGVIIAIACWIAFNTYWADVTESTPPEGEAATNPYYSIEHLLRSLGIRAEEMTVLRPPPNLSDVLLVNESGWDVAHGNISSVEQWVRGGGRMVVTTSMLRSSPALQTWSGITRALGEDKKDQQPPAAPKSGRAPPRPATVRVDMGEIECEPMTLRVNGLDTVETRSICATRTEFSFASQRVPSWALVNGRGIQMLRVGIGRGSLTVIDSQFLADPLTLLRNDNALAIIEGSLLKKGERLLIFNALGAEPLLAMIWRLAAPAVVSFGLVALLLIVRHLPRFGPPLPVPVDARRSLAEQLRANARFAWRTGNLRSLRKAVLRALERGAEQRIPGYGSLSPWRRAEAIGKTAGVDATALASAMTEDAAGDAKVQRASIALLERARRALINF